MDQDRLRIWETLFQRALVLIDSVAAAGAELTDWSFGGGTVLMRRHHHRFSKDIGRSYAESFSSNHTLISDW